MASDTSQLARWADNYRTGKRRRPEAAQLNTGAVEATQVAATAWRQIVSRADGTLDHRRHRPDSSASISVTDWWPSLA